LHALRTIGAIARIDLLKLAHPRDCGLRHVVEHGSLP